MTTNLCPSCMCMTNDGLHEVTGELLPSREGAEYGEQKGPGKWRWTVVLTIDCMRRKNMRPTDKRTRIMLDLESIDKELARVWNSHDEATEALPR